MRYFSEGGFRRCSSQRVQLKLGALFDLAHRISCRLPSLEAEHVLNQLEDRLITCEEIKDGLGQKDLMEDVELSELECDAVFLDEAAWGSKNAPVLSAAAEEAGSYEWMDNSLARLLPEKIKVNKKMLNNIKVAEGRRSE